MFDMLDDGIETGYVPTVNSNSRSASMKKLSKKEPKVQPKQTTNQNNTNKNNDYDDLLDDLLQKQYKNTSLPAQNKKPAPKNLMANSFDSLLDDPKPATIEKPKLTVNPQPPKNASLFKAFNVKNDWSDDIISQDTGLNYGKNQSITLNKNEDSYVSTRNMKPPIKKRTQSVAESISFGGSMNLLLPEESRVQNIMISKTKMEEDDNSIKPPPRLMNRRSSIDKNEDSQFNRNQSPSYSLELKPEPSKSLDKKEQVRKEGFKLSLLAEPKVQNKPEKKEQFVKPSYTKYNEEPKKKEEIFQRNTKDKIVQKYQNKAMQPQKKGLNMIQDQSMTFLRDSPNQQTISTNRAMNEDFQKQTDHIKKTFQKQIDFLQQNLQKQITINKETRDKLMRQSNNMIEDERRRGQMLHEQEIKRMKQMFEWQKSRMLENYKRQIDSLRESLQFANKNNQLNYIKPHYSAREDSQYQEIQLKNQKKLVDDRQKILQKRELALQERQMEMTKRKRKEQQRLRMDQKRIIELQSRIKLQSIQNRKCLDQEKQQMAIQMAKIQLQVMRMQQKMGVQQKSYKIDQKALLHEKTQLRGMNADFVLRYKQKMQELQAERQHVKLLQQKLIEKIRIVQKKGKEFSQANVNKTMYTKKQNNWLQEKDISHQNIRKVTVQKQIHEKSQANIHKTKERYHNIQEYTKNRMKVTTKDKQKFNIDDFLVNVNQYNKVKS